MTKVFGIKRMVIFSVFLIMLSLLPASTVQAEKSVFAEATKTVNVAAGKPYLKSHTPSSSYPDSGNREFTDGLEGIHYSDGKSFGYGSGDLGVVDGGTGVCDITIDLGSAVMVDGAELVSGCGDTSLRYEADVLEVSTSVDGLNYVSQGRVGRLGVPARTLRVNFSQTAARFVRFRITKQLAPAGNPGDWLFITEGKVYSRNGAVPLIVESTNPTDGAMGVPADKSVIIEFSKEIQPAGKFNGVALKDEQGRNVDCAVWVEGRKLVLDPVYDLFPGKCYTVSVPAGAVRDVAGRETNRAYAFSFTIRTPKTFGSPVRLVDGKTFVRRAELPATVERLGTAIVDGSVYVFGGQIPGQIGAWISDVLRFDPASGKLGKVGNLPSPLCGMATVKGRDGKVYLIGGWNNFITYQRDILRYDPRTGVTVKVAELPGGRIFPAAAEVDGKIYIFGGTNDVDRNSPDIVEFDPVKKTVAVVGFLPYGLNGATAVACGESIYLFGGTKKDAGDNADIFKFTPKTRRLELVNQLPEPRCASAVVVSDKDGLIYLIGGYGARAGIMPDILVYDSANNLVATVAYMPAGRCALGAELVGDSIFVVGGGKDIASFKLPVGQQAAKN